MSKPLTTEEIVNLPASERARMIEELEWRNTELEQEHLEMEIDARIAPLKVRTAVLEQEIKTMKR